MIQCGHELNKSFRPIRESIYPNIPELSTMIIDIQNFRVFART